MATIDEVRDEWDDHLSRTSEAVIDLMHQQRALTEKCNKAVLDQRQAVWGYWKFKRIMEHAEGKKDAADPAGD